MRNLNAITPETDRTTHYFWAQAHDFLIDDPSVTELVYRQVRTAFFEDLAIIGSQQKNLDAYGAALPPQIDFKQDAGVVQARRVVDAILAIENGKRVAAE
jgi:vanillate O-demethylase monooxygenase subunit